MRGKTERIGKIIEGLLLKKGITKKIQLKEIKTILYSFFSEEEKRNIKVGTIKNKKLYIYVRSPGLLYEVKCFKKELILEKIKQEGKVDLKDICIILDDNSDG